MEIVLLGPVQARVAGQPVALGSPQHRLMLAVLALEVNCLVPVDRLVELVWPVSPPRTAAHAVQVGVSRLRRLLAGGDLAIVRQGPGYALRTDPAVVDVHRYTSLVERARRDSDDRARIELLDQALALWTGPALSGTAAAEEVRRRLCLRLEETRLAALEDRLDARLRLGEHQHLLGEAAALVAEHPARERLVGQLMLGLYRCGRPSEALRAFRRLRQTMADELGLDPGPELRQLEVAILRGDPGLEPPTRQAAVPVGRPAMPVPAQLPPAVPGFAGRAAELSTLDRLAGAVPLAVVTGTAGVGKTALAVHWAHRVTDQFPDGQLYVNLRGFEPGGAPMEPAQAVHGFLDALGVPAQRLPTGLHAQIGLYRTLVTGKRMLILLDNARDAGQVGPLLPGSPGCRVVVTSRDGMTGLVALHAAQPVVLDLLTAAEARELLANRLGPQRLAAEPAAADRIVDRCARLPLALVIVAARAATNPHFPLHAIAAELDDGHGLDPLPGAEPVADVRAVFSWSYRTLTRPAGRLFRVLGLHPGPHTSTAAVASLAALPARQARTLLTELTTAHLATEPTPGRFALHDLLRAYAADLARRYDSDPERRATTQRVLDHYVHSAYTAALRLDPHRDPITLPAAQPGVRPERLADLGSAARWFAIEYPVLLAAADLAVHAGFDAHTWQLGWTLTDYLNRAGHWPDQVTVFQAAVRGGRRIGDRSAEGYAHRILARALGRLGHFPDAHAHLQQALGLFGPLDDPVARGHTHIGLSWLYTQQGDRSSALAHDRRALALFRSAGHPVGQARALNNIGWRHAQSGDHHAALRYCQRALELCRTLGDRYDEAVTLDSIGYAHHHLGDHRQAVHHYEEAVRLYREVGHRDGEAESLDHLGDTHHCAGNRAAARDVWQHALDILRQLGHPNADEVSRKLVAA